MCVIVDANTLSGVFKDDVKKKEQFEPILRWVLYGKGKFVIGGSKYIGELKKVVDALKFITLLKMRVKDKVIVLNNDRVDELQQKMEEIVNDKKFDDPHLPAMVIVSHCMIICSLDARSIEFVTRPKLYPKGVKVPRYYTGVHNADLLCDKYIDRRYKPLIKMSSTTVDSFLSSYEEAKLKKARK